MELRGYVRYSIFVSPYSEILNISARKVHFLNINYLMTEQNFSIRNVHFTDSFCTKDFVVILNYRIAKLKDNIFSVDYDSEKEMKIEI